MYDSEGLGRIERIKSIIEKEMTNLSDWKSGFDANLEKLIGVTPFHSSGEGYFDQELRGEWSASNVNFDIEQIVAEHEYVEMTKDSDSDAT